MASRVAEVVVYIRNGDQVISLIEHSVALLELTEDYAWNPELKERAQAIAEIVGGLELGALRKKGYC